MTSEIIDMPASLLVQEKRENSPDYQAAVEALEKLHALRPGQAVRTTAKSRDITSRLHPINVYVAGEGKRFACRSGKDGYLYITRVL